jgi:hypothetical protein
MSTVIVRNPEQFQPSKSDGMYFTVSADTASKPKFRFVYNVYVNGYPVFEGKSTPNPFGLGIIDVSRILDSYLQNYPVAYQDETPIFAHQTSPFSRPYSNEVVDYYIEVGEEYANTFIGDLTGFTGNGDQVGNPGVPSATFKSFLGTMGVNRNANLPSFNIGQFTLSGNPSPAFPNTENCLFLTNSPRIRNISTNEYYTLSFTNYELGGDFLSEPYYVQYNFYDKNGFPITSSTYSNIVSNGGGPATGCSQNYLVDTFTGSSAYNILNVGAGPMNIFNFPDDTDYYTVQLYGKAIGPTPTPTQTQTPSPTPTKTPGLSPTPTPSITPSTTPSTCRSYQIVNNNDFFTEVFYTDCNGFFVSFFPAPFTAYNACLTSYEAQFGITFTDLGPCEISPTSTPNVTPTPSSTPSVGSCVSGATLNITNTGWLKYNDCNGNSVYYNATSLGTLSFSGCLDCNTFSPGFPFADLAAFTIVNCGNPCSTPSVTPTPTPSSSALSGKNVLVRDCCSGAIEYQVVVDSNLNVDDVVVIDGQCYQIWSLGGDGSNGNYRNVANYINCNECKANFPCDVEPTKPSTTKPSVQPTTLSPSGGTGPCVTSYVPVSEVFQFWVEPDCNYFLNEQIMFKNRYGAWDYFRFQKYKSEGLGIDRQTYGQWNIAWGSSNPIKTTYSRGTTDYQTNILETHIVNSGYLNDPEFVWLEELYTTNDAYLVNPDGSLFPINIIGTEFVRKTKGNRSMTNIELTYVYSNNIKLLNN